MKIMWLCGNPGLYRAKSLADGGWIGALQTELVKGDIELVNVFEYSTMEEVAREGKVTYYPVHTPKGNKARLLVSHKCYDKKFNSSVKEIIEKEKPDIIQCWGSELGFGLIAKETDIPVVLHIQGLLNPYLDAYFPPRYTMGMLLRALNWNVMRYFRCYWRPYRLFRSNALREKEILKSVKYILGRTDWDKACASILAPQARYMYCSESLRPAIVRSGKWKWKGDKHLVVGTIISGAIYKGVDVILRTASLIKRMYGDGYEWNIYGVSDISLHERMTGIKGNEVNVYPRGRVSASDIAEKLRASDVYCHQSYIENSPNSVCEAQYLGVPIVAAMTGGIDTIIGENGGILVPANDAYRSAYHIIKIKTDKALAEMLSRNEIEEAEKRHSHVADRLMDIYKSILK